jgi:hypothetical protein
VITIEDILREYLPEYIRHYKMLPSQNRAIIDILTCQTNTLGGQTWYCENCQKVHYSYHSCKNRMCPKCQNNQTTDWLNKQYKKLLPVEYFMVTFTIPEELRDIFRNNQKICYNLLFKTSSESLRQLALDKRFIGGKIGMLGVLQTWAANLIYHPHITINFAKKKFLMHWKPLANLFRKNLCNNLNANDIEFSSIIKQKQWVVDIRAVGNGISSLKYLAKYIYRAAISNNNILSSQNGIITFRIKDNQTRKNKSCIPKKNPFCTCFNYSSKHKSEKIVYKKNTYSNVQNVAKKCFSWKQQKEKEHHHSWIYYHRSLTSWE